MLLLMVVGTALAGSCPEQPLSAALGWASTLRSAYTAIDEQRLEEAHTGLVATIPCIREEIDPFQAFELHRAIALGAFVDDRESDSRESWAAVRAIQPDWVPPVDLMPEGHPLLSLWRATDVDLSKPIPLQEMPKGGWRVDGVRQNAIPAARAFILQGFDGAGAVVHTGYYYDPAAIPDLEGVEMIPTRRGPVLDADVSRRARARKWGSLGAGTLAVGALATWGIAASAKSEIVTIDENGDTTQNDRVLLLSRRANGFSVATAALGATAATTAIVTWTVRW